jgi:multidrug resistance efflux pump
MNSRGVNWFYVSIGLLLLLMLYVNAKYFKGSAAASIGIARTKEYKVNSEKPSTVKVVNVLPGMQVKKGDLLIELTSSALGMDITKIQNHIEVLKSERAVKSKLISAQISYIKAQNKILQEELDASISEAKAELKMNAVLTKKFGATEAVQESPLLTTIHSLEQQKANHIQALDIKISNATQESSAEQHVLDNQISLLQNEYDLLIQEQKKLIKYATADGVIKNVYVKAGEQVESFSPLLEINPVCPTSVVVFLVGRKAATYPIGMHVMVSSYDQPRKFIEGKVIGLGSVSELPEILQKSTATKAFGQEVFIELPTDNLLANGEKVLVR